MAYTFVDLAYQILKQSPVPLGYREIWKQSVVQGLAGKVGSGGQTPWSTLGARLSSDILNNPDSKFIAVGTRPKKYFLKSRRAEIIGTETIDVWNNKPEGSVVESAGAGYSWLDLAEEVLQKEQRRMTYREIWEKAQESGLTRKLETQSAAPMATLGGILSWKIRNDPEGSKFSRTKDGKHYMYFLKTGRQETSRRDFSRDEFSTQGGKSIPLPANTSATHDEADLHPLLAWFVLNSSEFHGGKKIHTRTIDHTKTSGRARGVHQWMHPDMVGVYFPFGDLRKEVIDLSQEFKLNSGFQLFSFELKKSIDRSNYREYFFQAVSNSSWSNEGYLVASEISGDQELRRELERLSNAFGIGIIELDISDANDSRVLFNARNRKELDWDTISKLNDNESFRSFTKQLLASFRAGDIVNVAQYDSPAKSLSR